VKFSITVKAPASLKVRVKMAGKGRGKGCSKTLLESFLSLALECGNKYLNRSGMHHNHQHRLLNHDSEVS